MRTPRKKERNPLQQSRYKAPLETKRQLLRERIRLKTNRRLVSTSREPRLAELLRSRASRPSRSLAR